MRISGRGNAELKSSEIFLNGQDGIESSLEAGSLTIDGSLIMANSRYSLRFLRDEENEKIRVVVQNSNITGHFWGAAVLFGISKNSQIFFQQNQIFDNHNGGLMIGEISDSTLSIRGNNFTKNRGTVLDFTDLL